MLLVEIQFLVSRISVLTSENWIVDILRRIKVKMACHNLHSYRNLNQLELGNDHFDLYSFKTLFFVNNLRQCFLRLSSTECGNLLNRLSVLDSVQKAWKVIVGFIID